MCQLYYGELGESHKQQNLAGLYSCRLLKPQQTRTALKSSCLLTTGEEHCTKPRIPYLWFWPVTSLTKEFCISDVESTWLLLAQKWMRKRTCISSVQPVLKGMRKTIKVGISITCNWKLVKQDTLHMEITRWKLCLHMINLFLWCLWFLLCYFSQRWGRKLRTPNTGKLCEKVSILFLYLLLRFLFPNINPKKPAVFQRQQG